MKNKSNTPSGKVSPMTSAAAARIQSATAKAGNGTVNRGSFAARAQSTVSKGNKR